MKPRKWIFNIFSIWVSWHAIDSLYFPNYFLTDFPMWITYVLWYSFCDCLWIAHQISSCSKLFATARKQWARLLEFMDLPLLACSIEHAIYLCYLQTIISTQNIECYLNGKNIEDVGIQFCFVDSLFQHWWKKLSILTGSFPSFFHVLSLLGAFQCIFNLFSLGNSRGIKMR